MDHKTAYQILNLKGRFDEKNLKKRYRELMHLAHPDSNQEEAYPYDAREINEAYEYLKEHIPESGIYVVNQKYVQHAKRKKVRHWNAPENSMAYTDRVIFHEMEDEDGEVIGLVRVDQGKFYWTKEEAFPLFLKSLFECSGKLLSGYENLSREKLHYAQGELSFLLAKQFINQRDALNELVEHKTDENGDEIYAIPAMLELEGISRRRKAGSNIHYFYPSSVRKHRLYLKNEQGKEAGYLSFTDDRLYYIIIPLFEDRRVQVRISSKDMARRTKAGKCYIDVLLEMRFLPDADNLPENINLQIDQFLKKQQLTL